MDKDLIASLHPPRLPESFTQLGLADYLLAFGLGVVIIGVVLWIARPLWHMRAPAPLSRRARIREARLAPAAEGLPRLAEIAATEGLALTADESDALYNPQKTQAQMLAARESLLQRLAQNRRFMQRPASRRAPPKKNTGKLSKGKGDP